MKQFWSKFSAERVGKRTVWVISVIVMVFSGCGSGLKMNSQWRDREVAIDGKATEWEDRFVYVEKKNVVLGFFNDAEYLYVSLKTADHSKEVANNLRRQILGRGLTLWIDPKGGDDKKFGIKFPVGMAGRGMMGGMGEMSRRENPRPDPQAMRDMLENAQSELEIIRPDEEYPIRLPVRDAQGIEAKIGGTDYQLTYEIRIPLRQSSDHPYAVNVEPGKPVGVGFETGKFDREEMRSRRGGFGGGIGGGRPGGMGGGRRGGPGGMRGGFERPQMMAPFKLWVKVELAAAP